MFLNKAGVAGSSDLVRWYRQPGDAGTTTQDVAEHRGGQPSSEGVVLAWVIAAEQVQLPITARVTQQRVDAVSEGRTRAGQLPSRLLEDGQQRLPRERAQDDDRAQGRPQEVQFAGQPRPATVPLRRGGLVGRWSAMYRRRDPYAV